MFETLKNIVNSSVNFVDFLNHVSISQWDIENQETVAQTERDQLIEQQE